MTGDIYTHEADARAKAQQMLDLIKALAPAPPAPPAPEQPAGQTVAQQLKDLAELRASGILTDEEFEAQKRKLLRGYDTAPHFPASPRRSCQSPRRPARLNRP